VPAWAWTPAIDPVGALRDGADLADVTGVLDLARWPAGMRVLVRRERPHPGAQLDAFEERDGYRYQAIATNTAVGQLAMLGTGRTPGSPAGSGPAKTPGSAVSRPARWRSTRCGSSSR